MKAAQVTALAWHPTKRILAASWDSGMITLLLQEVQKPNHQGPKGLKLSFAKSNNLEVHLLNDSKLNFIISL